MNSKRIIIGGKTYNSVDEMPEDVRQKYEAAMQKLDKNQNGIPDILENGNMFADKDNDGMPDALEGLAALTGKAKVISTSKIIVNGQTYDSADQLPPEIRAKYEQAMSKLDANHNGIPDFMEGMMNQQPQSMITNDSANFAASNSFPTATPASASRNPISASPTIEPESTGSWIAVLVGITLIGFCLLLAAAGVWYFFLR